MIYFTSDYLLKLQVEALEFIKLNFSDCTGYADFIEVLENNDTSEEIILNKIDRDYLNEFIKYKEYYTILDGEELKEILSDEYINYFTDCDLISLLEYFTEITFIELLSYVYIYKYKDDYYAIWDI